MRTLALAIVLVLALAPMAYADFLTASPVGQAKMAIAGTVSYDPDGATLIPIGGQLGYGITDELDVVGSVSYQLYSGLPAGTSMSGFGYGAALKYTFLKENAEMPVSLAGAIGYSGTSVSAAGATITSSDIKGGVLVSKAVENFVPYGGAAYHSMSTAGLTSTAIQGNIGTAIAISPELGAMIEYNYYSISAAGATATNSIFGAGICWVL